MVEPTSVVDEAIAEKARCREVQARRDGSTMSDASAAMRVAA
jgi:hypothetical protein